MNPERWQQVKSMLAAALEQPTSRRAAFLASNYGADTALLREVQSLLQQPPDVFDACVENVGLASPVALSKGNVELFLKICGAVQFAHQHLVVHRDLKPANILVDADGEPKLLDFGIAKLVNQSDSIVDQTQLGRERLTPAYASPEQVRGEAVSTVSDVYTLGAILYELLAEKPAYRFSAPQPLSTELLRLVCEREPVRPSVAASAAECQRQLRGDLDRIVLRAMAKEPQRRYRGAGSLADDLQRYLTGRPVHARRDTIAYRTSKFVTRNKTAVSIAAVLVAALIASSLATFAPHAARNDASATFGAWQIRSSSNSMMLSRAYQVQPKRAA